jgi:hypothetical protein
MTKFGTALLVASATLALAACDGGTDANTTAMAAPIAGASATSEPAGALRLAGDGLRLGEERIVFGTPRDTALAAISRGMDGKPQLTGTDAECGPGPLDFATWDKGLRANFQDGKFVGWTGAVDLKIAEGIGFGSKRSSVEAAYHPKVEQTSLGTEFTTKDGLSGVFESEAKDAAVSDIWAGMTCIAR